MKVTIKRDSPRYTDWIRVFGHAPVEVEPAGNLDSKKRLRVKLSSLNQAERQQCARYIAETTHLPIDHAARISPTVDTQDVTVIEELFP